MLASKNVMWQSRVEIEHYSVVYFHSIITLEALWCRTSIKGGALNVVSIHEFTQHI